MGTTLDIRKNDQVQVLAGRDKGKAGRVLEVVPKKQRVFVEHVNIVKRHTRPNPGKNVKGGIMKREAPTKVITGIRRVLAGDVYLSEEISSRIMRKFASGTDGADESPVARLSDRELEVYNHIGQGLKTGQIAGKLNLSVKTIETYREHIKEKLSLNDATELVQSAIKWVHGEGN